MKLKILSCFVAVILAAGMLAGCRPKSNPSSDVGNASSGTASSKEHSSDVVSKEPDSSGAISSEQEVSELEPSEQGASPAAAPSASDYSIVDSTSSTEEKSAAEVVLTPFTKPMTADQVAFTLYHFEKGSWDALLSGQAAENSFINQYMHAQNVEALKKMKASDQSGWFHVGKPDYVGNTAELDETWVSTFKFTVEALKTAGVWDNIIGFELEELCIKISGEQFRALTKFLADNFPRKRILAVLSYYEATGAAPGTDIVVAPITYDTYGYVTDIGYDWYQETGYEANKNLVAQIKKQLGRTKVNFWFFPCSYKLNAGVDEEYMLASLNTLYRLLKEQEHPGGLVCYTWTTFGSDTGLDQLLAPDGQNYSRLAARMVEIGKEITQMKLK